MIEVDRKPVSAVGVYDFCKQVEELMLDGWRFNFEDNDCVPINYGMMLYCIMEKPIAKPESTMGEFTVVANGTITKVATEDFVATSTEIGISTNVETNGGADASSVRIEPVTSENTTMLTDNELNPLPKAKRGRPKAE